MKVARLAKATFVSVDGTAPYSLNPAQALRALEDFLEGLPELYEKPAEFDEPASHLSRREIEALTL